MKTKISRISRRTVAMVLVLLLIFSALITANAANSGKKATGGYNWNANIFFRVPDGWNLSSNSHVQAWAVQSTSASSGTKYAFLLGTMSVAGTTSNSRLYHAWVSASHGGWGIEYIAFTANNSNWSTGDFYISTCAHYTKPLAYGATSNSGSYLFSPSDASNNTATFNNTITGSYNGSNRDVLKKNQDYYIYTGGSSGAAGGSVAVTAHYVIGSSYNGSGAIASSSITVNSSDSGAHEQYGGAVEGTQVSMTATPNDGYNFDGYYTAGTGGSSISSSASYNYYVFGTKSVYARFSLKTYTISYNKGANGTGTVASTTKTHGTNATLSSSTFTRTGYTQDGWSTTDGGAKAYNLGGIYSTNASTTLYPHWTQNTHNVSASSSPSNGKLQFSTDNSTWSNGPISVAEGATYYVKATPNTGYKISSFTVGGSAVAGASGSTSAKTYTGTMGTSDVTAAASFSKRTYTVTYNGNENTGGSTAKGTKTYGTAYTIADNGFTKTGYHFTGWNTKANGSGTSYAVGASYTTNAALTLYAQWEIDTYTVTYSKGSASGATGSDETDTKTYGVDLTLADEGYFTRTGYHQTGWNTNASGSGGTHYDLGGSYTSNSAVTLYPEWTQNTYTVKKTETGASTAGTVKVGSTTITTSGVSIAHGTYTVTVTAPTGYNVSAVSIGGTAQSITAGSSVTINSVSITAAKTIAVTYAQKTYAITFNETGGSGIFQADGEAFTSGSTVTHGDHSFTITAPSGYNVSTVTGFGEGSWTGIGTGTASLASTAVTSAKTVNVTYALATTPGVTVEADYDNSSNKANIGTTVTVTATKTHPSGSSGAMTYSVKLDDAAATVNTDYTISTSTSGNVTTYTIVPLKAGVFKVTAGYTDTGNPSATATFGVNTPTITVANNSAIKIGQSYTISPTITNTSGSGWEVVYSATSGSAATLSGDSIKAVTTGTAGFSASLQYNGVQKAATTFSVTPVVPTVAFGTTTAASINIGGSVTRTASKGSNEVGAGITSDTVSYSSSQTSYATVNGSGVVTGVAPGTTTISATRTIVCDGVTTTVDTATNYNVTVNTPGISAFSYSTNQIYIDGNTSNPSVTTTNPSSVSSPWSVTYSITGGSDYATINTTTGVVTGVYTGSATNRTVTVTASLNYNGTSKATRTATVTVKPPTVSFTSSSAVALNVGATNTNTASGSNPTGGTVTYSGTNQYINVNASTGQVTALKPTSSPQTVTATYTVTSGGQTTTVSTTYNVTVGTPSITFNGPATLAVGDKAATTVSATNVTSPSYTYDVKTGSSYASVDSNGKVTGLAAGTATIRVTATKQSWTDTAEITVNVQAPSMTIEDVESDGSTVLYTTVGTNITKAISANFNGTYSYSYSKSGVATASVSNGTLTITPQAKGSTTITVTDTKAAAQITASSAGKSKSLSKGKLATGAAGDITATQTFTVNVAEAPEAYKYIYFENGIQWNNGIKIYLYGGNGDMSWPGQDMVKIGTNSMSKDIYAYRYPSDKTYDHVIIYNANNNSERVKISGGSDLALPTNGNNTLWCDSIEYDGTAGWYSSTVVKPQITVNDVANLALGSDATLTATVVNQTTPSKFKWASADTNKVSVASDDTGTTNTNTITGTNATGATTVEVTAYCAMPVFNGTALTSIVTNGTADDYLAGKATANVTTSADPRTVSWGNKLKASSSGTYDDTGASAAGSITVTNGPASSGGTVAHGTSVTFSASANPGYQHVGWKVNDGANEYTTSDKTISVTSNTTVYALFDKKYTLTFTSDNGTVTGEGYSSSKLTTWSGATPATLTVTVATGKQIDWANSTNLAKYYNEPSTTFGTVTLTGKTVASADEIDSNVTIAYKDYEPTVNFNPYKTDDGSTYTAGGGELTAAWTTSGSGSGSGSDGASAPGGDTTYYLHIGKQSAFRTNTAIAFTWDATNSVYYASYNVTDTNVDIPFVINTTSGSLGDGNKSSLTQAVHSMNNSTYNPDGLSFNYFSYNGNGYDGFDCFKFGVNSSRTLYFTFASAGSDLIVRSSTNYTPGGSGSGGGGGSSSSGAVTNGGTIPYGADVTFTAPDTYTSSGDTYKFIGWYSTAQPDEEETALSTTTTYTKTNVTSDVNVYAIYKKSLYLTFYNSYVQDKTTREFNFTAAPPRTVKVGMGESVRATYTYKAGNEEQRGEEHTKNSTSDYYEGNRLLVLVGETVTLEYSTLASSDAISGIFFNNSLRYTTETEPDNLYKQRVKYTGEDPKCWGAEGDDEWDYTYLPDTTLYADENYYTGATATTIHNNASSYKVQNNDINQNTHTVSWVATQSYLNIDIELGTKYQLHINEDKYDGINIANMNDEGYYYAGEAIESVTPDHTNGLKITLDNTTDTSGTYSFTSKTPTWKDKDGNTVDAPSGVYATPYKSDNNPLKAQDPISSIDHWIVYGTMPASDLYLEIRVAKEYNIKLSNIVVSDNGSSKKTMLTECGSNSTSDTDCIGTISGKVDGTAQAALTDDGTYFTYDGNNNAGHVEVYTDGSSSNNRYLNGGVNKGGYNVTAGQTVSYTFEWNTGKDAEYSFVGWFEGKLVDNTDYKFEPDYNKKLSGKESFTFTPAKNMIVMAVATRDIYIGGNFTSDGAYASSTGNTWSSGRPLMDFDPTYVNPNDSTKKGRYTYTFDSVTANTEYQFRCYDTASGTATSDLSVWNQWGKGDYATDADDVFYGRHMYEEQYGKSHGQFVYKTNTNNWSLTDNTAANHDSTKNHQANGYAAPVTVYFYAYDGGMSVAAEYQWSRAYVSEGRGIDVKSVSGNTTTYNTPTASVANKTVNNKDVTVTPNTTSYGHNGKTEKIHECLVKEKNGSIVVTAKPADENLELQAFLVYNIETKTSESVKEFTKSGSGDSATYTGNIPIPNNSKIYVCPIYKFTDAYISAQNLESHNVFVRADEIDKDDWGGLVSMYSWGTASGYDSGGWPGQLMIPSDDGSSFYAPLTFQKGGLAGVTFTNYTPVNGGDFINFLGKYQDAGVSDVAYSNYTKPSAANNYQYQVFDYREPISIIENLNETNPKIYDSEDMTLTFALKPGNKASGTVGNGSYNDSHNFEYLTDSSGKYRVDLNGNKLSTNPTASYYIVCNYTEAYAPGGAKSYDFADGDRDGTSAHNRYSIDWNVYDHNHQLVTNGTMLSASFTDVHKAEMLTHVAKKLIDDGQPVSGKSVMIAYENPKVSSSDNTEAVRYSGQWYADSTNTIIKGNVRVGILSDGAFIPSETNAPGYATATVGFTPNTTIGEKLSTETGCTGNSLAEITKIHASNGDLQYTVSTKDNFEGWYRKTKDGDFEPIGSNYKSQTINPSFNEDITYYAFYSASASYRFGYTARNGSTKYYSVKGKDLSPAELAAGGFLDIEDRASDIASKLGGASNIQRIRVFNRDFTYNLSDGDNSKAYTITFNDPGTVSTYKVGVYGADGKLIGKVTSQFGATAVDLYRLEVGSKPANTDAIPRTYGGEEFIGWKQCDSSGNIAANAPVLSTMPHFGYNVISDMYIKPVYGTAEKKVAAQPESWSAYIDKNIITQELTSSSEGTLYNDSVIAFRYGQSTNTTLPRDETKICGIVVVSQTDGATDEQKTRFSGITKANLTKYANYFRQNSSVTVGKMNATNFGEAYAFHIKANSLSDLNRVDLCQVVDYAKFHDGNYKVMAYYYDGTNCICSDLKSGTYTVPNLGS